MAKTPESAKGSVWPVLLTAHAVLVDAIEARLAGAGLPPLGWYDVLWALERAANQRLRMSDLAAQTVLSRSNLTRLVDRLEEAGLVQRERSADDRRGAFAVLTAEGRATRKCMWPVYETAIGELFESHVTDVEAVAMGRALRRVLEHARSGDPSQSGTAKPGQ